tara:strand:+ start:6139 stop:7074 length:936 start_codon:yes stop_codon:yes gene_type:complete
MYKKIISVIIIILSLLYLFYNSNKIKEQDFKIEDITIIESIYLSDMKGNQITLLKHKGFWMINNLYKVRKDAIKTLLETIQSIEVQQPVSENAFNNVVRNLATSGVKVEIYSNKLLKTYYVGHTTQNHLGTYMIIKDANNPFIVHIPGFNGFLSPRYGIVGAGVNINDWRDNTIFILDPDKIIEIQLNNITNEDLSFHLFPKDNIVYNKEKEQFKTNTIKVLDYLNNFQNLNCESYKNEVLINKSLLYTLEIKTSNKKDILKVYKFDKRNKNSNNSAPNVERYYAKLNNGELMLIQKYVFNNVFISINDLR